MKFIKKQALTESVETTQEVETKEVLQEAVSKERGYTRTGIENAIQNVFKDITDEVYDEMVKDVYYYYGNVHNSWSDELAPEEVDELLNELADKYAITPEQKDSLETFIVNDKSYDPVNERKQDFESDVKDLKNFLEEAAESKGYYAGSLTVSSKKFYEELVGFLHHLEELNYTGAEKE